MIVPSPAKLNLFLHITGRRPDGMHELQTIFQLLDYGDTLVFNRRGDTTLNIQCNCDIAVEENTVYRCAKLLHKYAQINLGADIRIDKKIPIGAGLGGGSSNAATALCVLNNLWEIGLSKQELLQIGAQIGADVPVFINGHSAWGEGIGEKLTNLCLHSRYFTVFTPAVNISTAEMFNLNELKRDCVPITYDEYRKNKNQVMNVFEMVVRARYPEIDRVIKSLSCHHDVFLSGTGSAFFVISNNLQTASSILDDYAHQIDGFVAPSADISPLHKSLSKLSLEQ